MSTTNDDDKITTAARAVRLELLQELERLAATHAPGSTPGVALSTHGDPVLLISMTPELGARLATILELHRGALIQEGVAPTPPGAKPTGAHVLALRTWVEAASRTEIEYTPTHSIEVHRVHCWAPCAIRTIEVRHRSGSTDVIWSSDLSISPTVLTGSPMFRVASGVTLKIALSHALDHVAAGVVDLFYEQTHDKR